MAMALPLVFPCFTSAQVVVPLACSSKIVDFPNDKGTEVLVRRDNMWGMVIHYKDAANPCRHCFIRYRYYGDSYVYVGFEFDYACNNEDYVISYDVHDMQMCGDTCYLCGEAVKDCGAPQLDPSGAVVLPRFMHYGFIARLTMSPVPGGTWNMQFGLVTNVQRLNQLAVCHHALPGGGYNRLLVATAERDYFGKPSCLVEMEETQGSSWQYKVVHTDMADEVFTDVIARGNDIIVSSMINCGDDNPNEGDHWKVCLHQSTYMGYDHDYLNPVIWESPFIHDMRTLTGIHSYGEWGWHADNTPMRMCPMGESNFMLAYATRKNVTGMYGLLVLPYASTYSLCQDPIIIEDGYGTTHIEDLIYSTGAQMVMGMERSVNVPDGYVPYGNMQTYSGPGVMSCTDTKIESVANYGPDYMLVGGHWTQDKTVSVRHHQVAMFAYTTTCSYQWPTDYRHPYPYLTLEKKDCMWIDALGKTITLPIRSFSGQVHNVNHVTSCFYPWVSPDGEGIMDE